MRQKLLKNNLRSFFMLHQAQREILIFLLENHHDSRNYVRLQDALNKAGFEKKVSYKAVDSLHKKGWICFMRSSQLRASWIGYNEGLPGNFLRELRTALAQAKDFSTWYDFIVSKKYGDGGPHHATGRTHTTHAPGTVADSMRESTATKELRCSNGSYNSDVILCSFKGDAGQARPEGSPPRKSQHRFDPQGLPLCEKRPSHNALE